MRMPSQIPGFVDAGDITGVMINQGGYFPSYNVPYVPQIFNLSGGWAVCASLVIATIGMRGVCSVAVTEA